MLHANRPAMDPGCSSIPCPWFLFFLPSYPSGTITGSLHCTDFSFTFHFFLLFIFLYFLFFYVWVNQIDIYSTDFVQTFESHEPWWDVGRTFFDILVPGVPLNHQLSTFYGTFAASPTVAANVVESQRGSIMRDNIVLSFFAQNRAGFSTKTFFSLPKPVHQKYLGNIVLSLAWN